MSPSGYSSTTLSAAQETKLSLLDVRSKLWVVALRFRAVYGPEIGEMEWTVFESQVLAALDEFREYVIEGLPGAN